MRAPLALLILVTFFITSIVGPLPANADEFVLPKPGVMIHLSPPMNPPVLKGIKVHTDNPFRFDFILDVGDGSPVPKKGEETSPLREESEKLIKYFLASLTIPEKDLWVNLSPYEKDRIVPESFGVTEMGRDLLAEDYMLKQITASLIYPEDEVGKKFWKRIYEEAQKKYGNTNIPVNTFNKVWIVPEKAVVYENAKVGTAYVVESRLKVMLEADYLSLAKHENVGAQFIAPTTKGLMNQTPTDINQIGSDIVRQIVIPELTKEVNEGKNFAQLRQVYNSLILATWYKKKIRDSILSQVYADKSKTQGVNIDDPQEKEKIYQQYLKAFKKGVYNYIKEEPDPVTNQTTPRKYFSGGFDLVWSLAKGSLQFYDDKTATAAMRSFIDQDSSKSSFAMITSEVEGAPIQAAPAMANETSPISKDIARTRGLIEDNNEESDPKSEAYQRWFKETADSIGGIYKKFEEYQKKSGLSLLWIYLQSLNNKDVEDVVKAIELAVKEKRRIIVEICSGDTKNALDLAKANPDALVLATDYWETDPQKALKDYLPTAQAFEDGKLEAQEAIKNENITNLKVVRAYADILLYFPDDSISNVVGVQPAIGALKDLNVLVSQFGVLIKLRSDAKIAILASDIRFLEPVVDQLHFKPQSDPTFLGVNLKSNSAWQEEYLQGALYVGERTSPAMSKQSPADGAMKARENLEMAEDKGKNVYKVNFAEWLKEGKGEMTFVADDGTEFQFVYEQNGNGVLKSSRIGRITHNINVLFKGMRIGYIQWYTDLQDNKISVIDKRNPFLNFFHGDVDFVENNLANIFVIKESGDPRLKRLVKKNGILAYHGIPKVLFTLMKGLSRKAGVQKIEATSVGIPELARANGFKQEVGKLFEYEIRKNETFELNSSSIYRSEDPAMSKQAPASAAMKPAQVSESQAFAKERLANPATQVSSEIQTDADLDQEYQLWRSGIKAHLDAVTRLGGNAKAALKQFMDDPNLYSSLYLWKQRRIANAIAQGRYYDQRGRVLYRSREYFLSYAIQHELPAAIYTLLKINLLRNKMDQMGLEEMPLIVWQNESTGAFYPLFDDELKKAFGITEVYAEDIINGQPIKLNRLTLVRGKLSSDPAKHDASHLIFVNALKAFVASRNVMGVMIDHSLNQGAIKEFGSMVDALKDIRQLDFPDGLTINDKWFFINAAAWNGQGLEESLFNDRPFIINPPTHNADAYVSPLSHGMADRFKRAVKEAIMASKEETFSSIRFSQKIRSAAMKPAQAPGANRAMMNGLTRRKALQLIAASAVLGLPIFANAKEKPKRLEFVPETPMLIVGQSKEAIETYVKNVGEPAGFAVYTSLKHLEGLTEAINYGSGTQHAGFYLDHKNTVLQVGLDLRRDMKLKDVLDGLLDGEIKKLAEWIKSTNRPVYLRIGYEFDLPDNKYDPKEYQEAFKYIVNLIRAQRFDNKPIDNVAFVWHSVAYYLQQSKPTSAWYPGDDYVDFVAISYFRPDSSYQGDKFAREFARKPLMIAESSAWSKLSTQDKLNWYDGLFKFIHEHNVRIVTFNPENWNDHKFFQDKGWGNTQVHTDQAVLEKWKMGTGKFLKSSGNLFDQLNFKQVSQAMKPAQAVSAVGRDIVAISLNSGGRILTNLDRARFDRMKSRNFRLVRGSKGLDAVIMEDDESWNVSATPFHIVNGRFDLLAEIERIRQIKGANEPITVLDYGCEKAVTLKGMYEALQSEGIRNVRIIGYSDEFYTSWQDIPSGVELILDSPENLLGYFKSGQIDLIYSHHGLRHYGERDEPMEQADYYLRLASLLSSKGVMITDKRTRINTDSLPKRWPWVVEDKVNSRVWRLNTSSAMKPAQALATDGAMSGPDFYMGIYYVPGSSERERDEFTRSLMLLKNWAVQVIESFMEKYKEKIRNVIPQEIKKTIDIVTAIPPTLSRDSTGDGSVLFAQRLAQLYSQDIRRDIKAMQILSKNRATDKQSRIPTLDGRRLNTEEAFSLTVKPENIRGKTVLVVDDVYDSGETFKEVQRVLEQAGAKVITLALGKSNNNWSQTNETTRENPAMKNKGGIDLTSNKFLQTQNAGEGIKFHMDPAMLQQLQNAPGFYPVIINIQPMTDLKGFLGISEAVPAQTTA